MRIVIGRGRPAYLQVARLDGPACLLAEVAVRGLVGLRLPCLALLHLGGTCPMVHEGGWAMIYTKRGLFVFAMQS